MSTTTKRPYTDALAVATELAARLEPACVRLLIAGSLRREKAEIGDVELVAIPRTTPTLDLFGQPAPGLEQSALDDALAALGLTFTKNGPKYKQFAYADMTVDLFLATAETWGCVATIRTGSADFAKWLVTERKHGGGCPTGMAFRDGRLWHLGRALDTPEEADLFAALEQPWVAPVERVEGRWRV